MISQIYHYFRKQNAKFIFLALMLAVLPSLEAPKNLFALFFLISWVVIAIKSQDWGGKWQLIDTLFLLWILADVAVGFNAVLIHDQPANGSKDIIRFVLIGWAISRSRFSDQQIIHLCLVAIFFTIPPLVYTYLNCRAGGECLILNSVGHVNHTAIYLLIVYTITISLLIFDVKKIGKTLRIGLLVIAILLSYAIIDTWSRAASGMWTFISISAMGYAIYVYRNLYSVVISVIVTLLVSTFLAYNTPIMLTKKLTNGTSLIGESPRQKIRNFAYYVFKIDPILGTGMDNFPNFDHKDIKELVIKDTGQYNEEEFLPFKHPHSVYYNYLTGGGIVLLSVLVLFWLKVATITYQSRKWANEKWLTFGSVGVMMTVFGVGLINTTLANEHALITMFFIGLLISKKRDKLIHL